MRVRILRLMVALWLMVSPLTVTLDTALATASVPGDAANPIEWRGPIEPRPPLRPLSAGTPQTITLQIVPATLIANSSATAAITATVYDLTGDLVSGVNLSGFISPTLLGNVSGLGTTDVSGTVTGTWTAGTAIDSGTLEVGDGVISETASINLIADVPFTVTLQANPVSQVVGASSTLTATVVDQFGNAVSNGTNVTFASTIGGPIAPASTTNGLATSSISSALAGTAFITATAGGRSGSATVVFTSGSPFTVTLLANPVSQVVGASSTLTATVVDQFGNAVPNGTNVTFASTIGGPIAPASTTNGLATSSISSALAGTAFITATAGGRSGSATVVFTSGSPFTVTLLANPTSQVVGASSTLTATVVDQFGNAVSNGTNVTFASTIGGPIAPASTTNGLATSSISSALAGTAFITATAGGRSGSASVVFTSGSAFTVTLLANPTSQVVGASSTLTATVVDQFGNAVSNGTNVTFASTIGGPIAPASTTNGLATSSISSALAGTAFITATAGGRSGSASVTFTPGSAFTVTLLANPTSQVVGASSTLTATVVDQFGNAVPNGTNVTFASTIGGPIAPASTTNGLATSSISSALAGTAFITATAGGRSGSASVVFTSGSPFTVTLQANPTSQVVGASSTLTATVVDQFGNAVSNGTNVTFASTIGGPIAPASTTNGLATSSISSALAGTAFITATAGGRSGSATVVFTSGSPFTVTLQANPVSQVVGASSTLTATVVDQFGNAVSNGTNVTFASTIGGPIAPASTTNGLATSSISSALAGTAFITATAGGRSGSATVVFTSGSPFTVTLLANPVSQVVGASSTLTATVVDQFGNAVPNGTSVAFATSRGTVLTPRLTTNGLATSSISSTLAGTAFITATSGSASGSASVIFTPGAAFTVTLQANPTTQSVGASSTLTATVVDQFGNAVPNGTNVTFASTIGGPIAPASTTNGLATSSISSALAGTAFITATAGGRSGSATVVFTSGSPFTVTLLANPVSQVVGASSTLTATVVDQFGNAVPNGTNVTFASTIGGPIAPASTTNGLATSSISSALAGTAFITATAGGRSGSASVVFTSGSAFTVTLLANPTSQVVGASSALTATVVDQFGNAVSNGTSVAFTTSRGTVLTPRLTTNGLATSSISSTLAGTAFITATAGGRSGSATVVFTPGTAFTVTLLANPVSQVVGASSTLTATVVDQFGNAVSNGTSVIFATSRGTVLTPRLTTNGLATSSISSTLAGTAFITATSGSASGSASVVFTPGAAVTLSVQPPTAVISAGQRITYTAIATDTYGNLIGNVTSSTTFSIAPASGGVFVANAVTPTIKNTWIVTGVNGSAVSTATLTVTAAAFNRLTIENAPAGTGSAVNAVTLNIYTTLTVYAAAYDAYDNLIGARSVTWGGTGVVAGNLSPVTGISTTFTPVMSGTGTITATSSSIADATGIITVQAPFLRISKTASPDPLTPGSLLQYTILYTNTGNAPAQNVIITETYPISTAFSNAVPAPSAGTNVWAIGSLAVNDPQSIVVFMTTTQQMPVGTVLTNSVRMSAAKVTTTLYTLSTPVNALPDLSASITDSPDPARPGELLTYTLQYRNTGTAPVTNVRITDTYPAEVSFVSSDPPPDIYPNVWLTGTLNAVGDNSRTIVVRVRVNSPLADATILTNRVVVSAQEAPPYTTTQQTLIVTPRLQLTKSAQPITPTANGLLTYTLRYTNTGSSYAANPIVTDTLSVNTSFVQCAPIGCGVNGNNVTWQPGQLGQQTSNAVTLTVRIANNLPDGSVITNTARVTSTEQVSAVAQLTTTIASAPEVSLSNSDGLTTIAAGQLTTYTLSASNVGTAPAASVVITDRLPDYTTFVACSACVAIGGGVYSFSLGTLNASESRAPTLSVRVASTLPAGLRAITNTAAIATSTAGDALANNNAQDVNDISTRPVLDLGVSYDASTPYPGKLITYTVRYTNTSAMDTTGAVISTTRPAWTGSTPPGWTPNGPIDLRSIGNLAAGQSGAITYSVTLPLTFTLSMNAFSQTFVIQDGGPGGLSIATDQSTALIGVPDLVIDRVNVPPATVANRPFTVTVVIRNAGLGRACNPSNCGGFYLDTFVDPAAPPPSYPFVSYGSPTIPIITTIAAGQVLTVTVPNISYTTAQKRILYFKVDNYGCPGVTCLPVGSKGGLVPEYNEGNNVSGPIALPTITVRLPLILRK